MLRLITLFMVLRLGTANFRDLFVLCFFIRLVSLVIISGVCAD